MFSNIKKALENQKVKRRNNLFHKLAKEKIRPDMGEIERQMTWLEIKSIMDKSFQSQYQVAKQIHTIAIQNEVSKDDLHKIVQLFNSANQAPHFSPWLKGSIETLIREKNLRYRTLLNQNLEIIEHDWKSVNPTKLQGVVDCPLIDRQRLFFNFRSLDWGLVWHALQLNFEIYNQWADLEATGYDEIIIKGVIVEDRFEEFAKMLEDMGLKFYLELHKEEQHLKTASNLVGLG